FKSFIFPDFQDLNKLEKYSDLYFNGVRFNLVETEAPTFFQKSQQNKDFIAAAVSSSGKSLSSDAKKRRFTRSVLYKSRIAYSKACNIKIPQYLFNQLVIGIFQI
ncbi:unnamed protein product, partial [Brachionus calyciflorus]